MIYNCDFLSSLNIEHFDTSYVTNIEEIIFQYTSLDLGKSNKLIIIEKMLYGCLFKIFKSAKI